MKKYLKFLVLLPIFALALFVPGHGQVNQNTHYIMVAWTPGTTSAAMSATVNYGVYRATVTGGPYTRISQPSATDTGGNAVTSWADQTGVPGTKYFYVVTAIDSMGVESKFSPEASATMIGGPVAPSTATALAH